MDYSKLIKANNKRELAINRNRKKHAIELLAYILKVNRVKKSQEGWVVSGRTTGTEQLWLFEIAETLDKLTDKPESLGIEQYENR